MSVMTVDITKYMFKRKKREIVSLQILTKKCIRCERCVSRCCRKVLGMMYKDGKAYTSIEYKDRCVGCGGCVRTCPSDAIELITV